MNLRIVKIFHIIMLFQESKFEKNFLKKPEKIEAEKEIENPLPKQRSEEKKEIEISKEELEQIDEDFQTFYILFRKEGIIQKPKDFEQLYKKDIVRMPLRVIKEKNLESVLRFCNIKTPEQLEKLCEKDEVINMLRYVPEENLELVLRSCDIKTQEQFEKLCEIDKIRSIFTTTSEKNLESVLRFCNIKTPEQLEKLCEITKVGGILQFTSEENFELILKFFQINKLKDFKQLCENKEVRNIFIELTEKDIKKIENRDFKKSSFRKKMSPLIENHPLHYQISSEFIKNIRSAPRRDDYQEKPELKELLKHIATSSTFSYLALEKPNKETLEKLKEKIERSTGEKQKMYQKLYGTIKNKNFYLSEVIPGQKAIKTLDKPENINYLSLSKELDIPFDKFGVIGKDLEEVKEEVDKRGKEIIEDYSQNKERYLPYLNSLLGYGKKHKEWMNKILKADDLWEFKTSHLDNDLKSVLDKIKDLETETGKIEGKETLETPIENLEAHLKVEEFSKAKKRISLIKEENREKALELIEKSEKVIDLLKQEKNPNPKDISLILANKGIFKHLELSLTWDSIRILSMKLVQGKREMEYSGSVEIFKEPEEYFGAMDKGDSCMRVEGGKAYGALTIAQGPIFIIGIKDKFKKIIGRSLLIPVKDEKGKWRFELNNTYGLGEKEIEDFAKKIEKTLKKEKKDYYKGTDKIIVKKKELSQGELPKTKTTSFSQNPKFWRDSVWGDVELKKVE